MEDSELGVFQSGTILDKQILSDDLINDLIKIVDEFDPSNKPLNGSLAHRVRIDEADIDKLNSEIIQSTKSELNATLIGYFPDMEIGEMRIYCQTFGDIKPHIDVATDGKSNVTCLIYLTDGYEGGELNIKIKRKDLTMNPEKEHFKFTITPKKGYGVCFNKDSLHYANEVFGKKLILLIDLKTSFLC